MYLLALLFHVLLSSQSYLSYQRALAGCSCKIRTTREQMHGVDTSGKKSLSTIRMSRTNSALLQGLFRLNTTSSRRYCRRRWLPAVIGPAI